jgi:hypothetical protein
MPANGDRDRPESRTQPTGTPEYNMSSLSADFTANRQARLPAAAQIKQCLRDHLIIDWLISSSPPLVQRMAVLFDYDRDERILDFLTAAHYACPKLRANIVGVAETKGRIAVFYGCPLTIPEAQRALSEAAYRALYPGDKWHVDIVPVPMRDGVLDRTRLDEKHTLHATPPRYQLGLIEVRS